MPRGIRKKAVSRHELYRMVEKETGYRYDEIRFIIDVMWTLLGRLLCQRRSVRITGFGRFEPFKSSRKRYRGFDDKIYSTDSKYTPKFRSSTVLKSAVIAGDPASYILVDDDAVE